jgi:sarcosine oxidase
MSRSSFDVAVVGLGGMGSAAAAHLAQRGLSVVGLERFPPVHAMGSSHGRSRVIRQAYFESADYVPLLRRAYELTERLGADVGRELLHLVGGLFVGAESSRTVAGSRASAVEHDIAHELLDAAELRRRFPVLRPAPDDVALLEPGAGYVVPEDVVAAHHEVAERAGADLRFSTAVLSSPQAPGPRDCSPSSGCRSSSSGRSSAGSPRTAGSSRSFPAACRSGSGRCPTGASPTASPPSRRPSGA